MTSIIATYETYGQYSHVPGHDYRDLIVRRVGRRLELSVEWGTEQGDHRNLRGQEKTIASARTLGQLRQDGLDYAADDADYAAAIRVVIARAEAR